MADIRMVLTERSLAQLAPPPSGQMKVRDTELRGFYLVIGQRRRTYMVQGDLRQNGKRVSSLKVTVGDAATMSAREARAAARAYLGEIGQGRHPKAGEIVAAEEAKAAIEARRADTTLRMAWERYLDSHLLRKGRSAGTIASYRDHVERVFKEWLDMPLRDLADDPGRVLERHDAITKASGPYIANGSMRTLRAIYNHARKANRTLPVENPVEAVDWNPEHRRNTAMGKADLRPWFRQVASLDNPIRREFHLMTLLSGCRPTALKEARVEHLDLRRRVLHIPRPKGGADRAFDIPLSRAMIGAFVRAMRWGRFLHPARSANWLFPADSADGHLVEHKEERAELSKWGNDLRQSYRTLATIAGVSEVDAKLLMNHAIPGVNSGYITRHKLLEDHLRAQQEAISAVIMEPANRMAAKPGVVRGWLASGAIQRAIADAAATKTG